MNAPQNSGGEQLDQMRERRQYPRITLTVRLWCEDDGKTTLVQTVNISRGGIFLQSSFRYEHGTQILLSHQDLLGELINIRAEVVWSRPRTHTDRGGIGLRFLNRESGQKLYEHFRNRHRRRESIPPVVAEWATANIYSKYS